MTAQPRPPSPSLAEDDDPRIQRVYRRLRTLTIIAALTMGVGFLAVMSVIAYRVVKSGGVKSGPAEARLALGAGAKVLSSAAGDGRVLVTVEDGGRTAIYVFDATTLKQTGRLEIGPGEPAAPPLR